MPSVSKDSTWTGLNVGWFSSTAWGLLTGNYIGNLYSFSFDSVGLNLDFDLATTIVMGSHINTATLTLHATRTATFTFKIKAELAGSPGAMANLADYVARRGLTPSGGVNDVGLVTIAEVAMVSESWTNGVDAVYDIAPLLQELALAYGITKVVIFVDNHDNIGPQDAFSSANHYPDQAVLDVDWTAPVIPPVTSVTPDSRSQGATAVSVVIAGSSFTSATVVSFGAGVTVNSFVVDSDAQITANITIPYSSTVGLRDVSVTNAAGTGTLLYSFIVLGLDFGAGITLNGFTVDSDEQITADIDIDPAATPGFRDVVVVNPLGSSLLVDGFEVLAGGAAPIVSGVTPSTGLQGETIIGIIIAGSNFTGATVVDFGADITVVGFLVDTDIQITAIIVIDPAAALGDRDVSVTGPGGTGTLFDGFTVLMGLPTIVSVTPNSGLQGQILAGVQIVGTNFNNPPVTVDFGAGIVVSGVIVSSGGTLLTCDLAIDPAATPGPRDVSVDTAAGNDTLVGGFTVTLRPPTFAPGVLRVPMTQLIHCG
jgi:hypothetical protein